jgi:glyoxylase-like metal-dependent hydrolase (beta-lactamase superfamily II)
MTATMYIGLTDTVGYVPGGTNIGVIRHAGNEVTLIDSGLNDSIARKVLRAVRGELDSIVVAIINTHGHADHFGANAFVQKRTGCEIWAPATEAAVIENPLLQPALLFGGASPVDALRTRFLLAEPSTVTGTLGHGEQVFQGTAIEVVPLPGHSPNQVGYLVDGIFFCADMVFPEYAIEKYRIPYLYSLTEHIDSLELARSILADKVVPGHGDIRGSIESLADLNLTVIDQTIAALLECMSEPFTGDDLAARVFRHLDVPVADPQAYYLLRPTISAYLAHMERTGLIHLEVVDGSALWRRA